jgi:hypothetical protein
VFCSHGTKIQRSHQRIGVCEGLLALELLAISWCLQPAIWPPANSLWPTAMRPQQHHKRLLHALAASCLLLAACGLVAATEQAPADVSGAAAAAAAAQKLSPVDQVVMLANRFPVEAALIVFLIIYLLSVFVGRAENLKHATDWSKTFAGERRQLTQAVVVVLCLLLRPACVAMPLAQHARMQKAVRPAWAHGGCTQPLPTPPPPPLPPPPPSRRARRQPPLAAVCAPRLHRPRQPGRQVLLLARRLLDLQVLGLGPQVRSAACSAGRRGAAGVCVCVGRQQVLRSACALCTVVMHPLASLLNASPPAPAPPAHKRPPPRFCGGALFTVHTPPRHDFMKRAIPGQSDSRLEVGAPVGRRITGR